MAKSKDKKKLLKKGIERKIIIRFKNGGVRVITDIDNTLLEPEQYALKFYNTIFNETDSKSVLLSTTHDVIIIADKSEILEITIDKPKDLLSLKEAIDETISEELTNTLSEEDNKGKSKKDKNGKNKNKKDKEDIEDIFNEVDLDEIEMEELKNNKMDNIDEINIQEKDIEENNTEDDSEDVFEAVEDLLVEVENDKIEDEQERNIVNKKKVQKKIKRSNNQNNKSLQCDPNIRKMVEKDPTIMARREYFKKLVANKKRQRQKALLPSKIDPKKINLVVKRSDDEALLQNLKNINNPRLVQDVLETQKYLSHFRSSISGDTGVASKIGDFSFTIADDSILESQGMSPSGIPSDYMIEVNGRQIPLNQIPVDAMFELIVRGRPISELSLKEKQILAAYGLISPDLGNNVGSSN